MEQKKYHVELYYGYEEGEDGIYHAFEAVWPGSDVDEDKVVAGFAEALDLKEDDDAFKYASMDICLPDSVVARIKADAVQEYLMGHKD